MEIYLYHDSETDRYICAEVDLLDDSVRLPQVFDWPCGHQVLATEAVAGFLAEQQEQQQCPICQSFGRVSRN
jgi:hypothetical protein